MALVIDRDKLFRKLALENRFVDEAGLRRAREHQKSQQARGLDVSLGEALMDLKLINRTQYLTIQRAGHYKLQRQQDKDLARVLIKNDYASREAVLDAMQYQKDHYTRDGVCRPLGDLLIERGELTVEQLKAAQKILAMKGRR
ncbi:MAG: hypothetical protein D6776_06795 [Planctomycetota bacterium]|nr:MAG: hypothetical protein D6776_06795 [Planctomycetota bacterium]